MVWMPVLDTEPSAAFWASLSLTPFMRSKTPLVVDSLAMTAWVTPPSSSTAAAMVSFCVPWVTKTSSLSSDEEMLEVVADGSPFGSMGSPLPLPGFPGGPPARLAASVTWLFSC